MSDHQGGRWRLTYEGVKSDEDGTFLSDSGVFLFESQVRRSDKAERLPDPEPDWQPGDLAAYYANDVLVAVYECIPGSGSAKRWRRTGTEVTYRDDVMPRPLVRLVPEGQS